MRVGRMTFTTAAVLQALAAGYRYGFDIAEVTGIRGGTVYPLLRRLEERGVLSSSWEDPEVGRDEGRPPRRYYRLRPEAAPVLDEARRRFPARLDAATATGPEGAR